MRREDDVRGDTAQRLARIDALRGAGRRVSAVRRSVVVGCGGYLPERVALYPDMKVRRYLDFKGYAVRHVMNITDVEDKIIRRVRETQTPLRDYTGRFEAAFLEDLKALREIQRRTK